MLERWNHFGLQLCRVEVSNYMLQKRDIASRLFPWEVGLGADYEMTCLKVIQRRRYLS